MPLISGRRLKAIMDAFSPFGPDGRLIPASERVTLLAANANPPLELWGRAFTMAAAVEGGSPIIIQLSYNALAMAGGAPKAVPTPAGLTPSFQFSPAVDGARLAHVLLNTYADLYQAPEVALSLDHFAVPAFKEGGVVKGVDPYLLAVAAARIEDARRGMLETFGVVNLDESQRNSYLAYLTSPEYQAFKRDFLGVVETTKPAWAMIDTEKLPPLLDFVVTREITEGVRRELGNQDVIIEAEFGATGQSGEELSYEPIRGDELQLFADQVAAFVSYTGAEGIAYPIGMEHAAKNAERHEPDSLRLEVVGRTVLEKVGRYVPFAQHGGTGAAQVARGLVGKNNINTHFLIEAAETLADHVEANLAGIRAGDKSVAGTKIYMKVVDKLTKATIDKIKETGSFGLAGKV